MMTVVVQEFRRRRSANGFNHAWKLLSRRHAISIFRCRVAWLSFMIANLPQRKSDWKSNSEKIYRIGLQMLVENEFAKRTNLSIFDICARPASGHIRDSTNLRAAAQDLACFNRQTKSVAPTRTGRNHPTPTESTERLVPGSRVMVESAYGKDGRPVYAGSFTMKRSSLRFGLLACIGFSALWLFLWWTSPRISGENFRKIEAGMSKSEVISILNCKPHDPAGEFRESGVHVWESGECRIYLRFDETNRVTGRMCEDVEAESLVQKIRRWIGIG